MSGAGFTIDMIRKDAANRKMRRARRKKMRDKSFSLLSKSKRKSIHKVREIKKYSGDELIAMKEVIKRSRLRNTILGWGLTFATVVVGVIVVMVVIHFII